MSFKYIEYQYPIAHVFHKEIFWVDKNCNVYFAFKLLESDDWVYYAGDASHSLKTGNVLTRYDSEAEATTNYLTTVKDGNNKVLAVLPLNFQAKYARIYIEEGSSVTIHEWIPSVYLTANEIIAGELLISDKLSDAPIIRVVSNLIDRLRIGNVGGYYGLFGYDASGNLIFELSDHAQTIGGWVFTQNSLSCTSGESGIVLDAAQAKIESIDYVAGSMGKGWHLGPDKIEVADAAIRGSVIKGSVFYQESISAVGGELLVAEADSLDVDMTANDSETLTIKGGMTLAVNDIVRIKADDGNDEWIQITGIGSAPTYNITRDKASAYDADSNPAWRKGAAVVNYGISGEGVVRVSASDTNAPFIEVITHLGQPWTDATAKARFGCLDGYLGCSGESFGFGVGSLGANQANLLYTSKHGLKIRSNDQDKMTFDHAGNAWISNNLTLGRDGIASGTINLQLWDGHGDTYIAAGKTDFTNVEPGFILGIDDSDSNKAKLYIGNDSTYLNWDGDSLDVVGTIKSHPSVGATYIRESGQLVSLGQKGLLIDASTNEFVFYCKTGIVGSATGYPEVDIISSVMRLGEIESDGYQFFASFGRTDSPYSALAAYSRDSNAIFANSVNFHAVHAVSLTGICVYARAEGDNAIEARSYSSYSGVYGWSETGHGIRGEADGGVDTAGIYGYHYASGAGVKGYSVSGYGSIFEGAKGPVVLIPSSSSSAPSHSALKGTLWVTSNGKLYINTNGSTTWALVGSQW